MDIVTLTDANLGLSNYPVRVIEIEEDDKGLLAFTCEELVTGVSNPAFNPNASSTGFQPNYGVPAVPTSTRRSSSSLRPRSRAASRKSGSGLLVSGQVLMANGAAQLSICRSTA